jgi:DNA-binding NarL/FixJ family response regulator
VITNRYQVIGSGLRHRWPSLNLSLTSGVGNAEIAAKLFSAAKTVDPYVSAELAKLDAPTRDVAASPATWLGLAGARKYRA